MPRLIAVIFVVAIVVYAFIVALQMNPKRTPAGIKKWIWVVFTLVPPVIGSSIFLVANYVTNSRQHPAPGPGGGRPSPRMPGPVAPDDDPDFLKGLDDELRRAQYDKRLREHEDDNGSSPS